MDRLRELNKVREILTKVDYQTLSYILDSYLPSVPIIIYDFDNQPFQLNQRHNGGFNFLYRGRLLTDNDNKPYSDFKQITCIGKDDVQKIKNYGRVNKPLQSMFYASTEMAVACLETFSKGINLDELHDSKTLFVQIGVWKIESQMVFARMTSPEKYFKEFVGLEQIKKLDLKKVTIESIKSQNDQLRTALATEEEFQILEFFSEEFAKTNTSNHEEYKLSNYYADRIFNNSRHFDTKLSIDGIMYPSVPSCYQELNVVLPPNVVDAKLKFLWCDLVMVALSKSNGAQFIPIKNRAKINSNGVIEWRKLGRY